MNLESTGATWPVSNSFKAMIVDWSLNGILMNLCLPYWNSQ